ncbi:MAG: hypothetical protein II794_00595 [Oscillospiraceae bacterium]|nr:hypothetical protein [Oscillospiraceae bacterium]
MTRKQIVLVVVLVIAAAAISAGITAWAAGTYGTRTDPLVTLSYLDETVRPEVMEYIDKLVAEKSQEMEALLDEKVAEHSTPAEPELVDQGYKDTVISLTPGQIVVCQVGVEIMPRVGTVESWGENSPRLIDESTHEAVTGAGVQLQKNHLYMVTIKNNGFKATSNAKVIIKGDYEIR